MSVIPARKRRRVPLLFHLLVLPVFATGSEATVQYSVSLEHPEQHLFHVTMTIPDVQGGVTVQMAAWNALYQIRDFSARVQQVEAFADGEKQRSRSWISKRGESKEAVQSRFATRPFGMKSGRSGPSLTWSTLSSIPP